MQLQKYHLLAEKIMHPGTPTCQRPLTAFCSPCLLLCCCAQGSSLCFLLLSRLNATDRDIPNRLFNIQRKTVIAIMTSQTLRSWRQSRASTFASVKRRDGWGRSRKIVMACLLPSLTIKAPGAWFLFLDAIFPPCSAQKKAPHLSFHGSETDLGDD